MSKSKHELIAGDVDLSLLHGTNNIAYEDQLNVHVHSDAEEEEDDDPYYEYNKCNTYTFLEKKLQENFDKFEPVDL